MDDVKTGGPKISIVVIAYNMSRELPRTLVTLRAPYQRNIDNEDIEIIVVDNGSSVMPEIPSDYTNVRIVSCSSPTHSPAKAINEGLALCSSPLIGLMVDGARLASPCMLSFALMADKLTAKAIIATPAYHLGNELQMQSTLKGYNQEVEDALLATVPWQENGYELFAISVLAGSSADGWFKPIAESNALFFARDIWQELEGVDEGFQTLGGGLLNLDLLIRACELKQASLISLLGEGTFHQVHGGIATNQHREDATWDVFHEEYVALRGKPFAKPKNQPLYFGAINPEHKEALKLSTELFCDD